MALEGVFRFEVDEGLMKQRKRRSVSATEEGRAHFGRANAIPFSYS